MSEHKNLTRETRNGATIEDDRTPEEIAGTGCFLVATDPSMSGWGDAPGRSLVAVPVAIRERFSADRFEVDNEDQKAKRERFEHNGYHRVRIETRDWRPRLRAGDHLHIYGMGSFLFPINYQGRR